MFLAFFMNGIVIDFRNASFLSKMLHFCIYDIVEVRNTLKKKNIIWEEVIKKRRKEKYLKGLLVSQGLRGQLLKRKTNSQKKRKKVNRLLRVR